MAQHVETTEERIERIKRTYQRVMTPAIAGPVIHPQWGDIGVLLAEVERLRAELMKISDQVTIWDVEWAFTFHTSIKSERLRWQFLGHLASKALQGEQP